MYSVETHKDEDGNIIAVISLESNTLPHVSIDTYQSFTGDSWLEGEFEYLASENEGMELDWSNTDVTYNHDGIKQALAEASIEGILNDVDPEIILGVEYESNWSPSFYNFETDTYTAQFTVNWTLLKKWLKKSKKDREEWMRERWSSYDGFHSHMYPGYWNNPQYMFAMRVYATIAMYLEETLDRESQFMAVAEAEWEAYSNNAEITISESNYGDMVAQRIADTVGEDFDAYDNLPPLLEARGMELEVLMAEFPLNPVAAADKLMERHDEVMPGQMELL